MSVAKSHAVQAPHPSSAVIVELQNITKVYGPASSPPVLGPLDLTVHAGEYVAIVGKSGSGKSTLLNLISALDDPTTGTVIAGGESPARLKGGARARWRCNTFGIVFQFYQLLPSISILDNILLTMELQTGSRPLRRKDRRTRALELLSSVGLSAFADRLPPTLSGGQQQRAAIARALANDPSLLILDEPTGSIDSEATQQVLSLLRQLSGAGKTILIVTHDDDVARSAGRRVTLADGLVVGDIIQSSRK